VRKSIDMDWNYIQLASGRMQRLADVFAKVEEALPALQEWERAQDRKKRPAARRKARPSRREVLA
jgi:hypothetical protein